MYEYLLIGPLLVLFLLLIYHSLRMEGKRTTVLFFGLGLMFALLRELIIGLTYPLYFGKFKIGPISPAIVFGWIFAFSLAYYFASRLTNNTRLQGNLLVKISLGTVVVLGISLVMETTAPLLEWWQWVPEVALNVPPEAFLFGAPLFVFAGWSLTGLVFLTIYYLVHEYGFKLKIIFVITVLFIATMAEFVLGNYFILHPAPIQEVFLPRLLVFSIYLAMLSYYVKKKSPKSVYANTFLNICYTVFEGFIIYALVNFLQNFPPNPLQTLYLTISLILLGLFAVLIIRKALNINSIANKKYKLKGPI